MTAIHAYHFAALDSTQRYLLEHVPLPLPLFCRADSQSAGVGQRAAHWQSPPGGLYFSLRYPLAGGAALHGGLAQAVALCIAEILDPAAAHLRLKWPNDLYLDGKKLGGILIDMDADSAVIGVGINICGDDPALAYCQTHFADINADNLYRRLQTALPDLLARWAEKPYLPADHRWNDYDRFRGQDIRLEDRTDSVKNLSIDHKGRLIVAGAAGLEFLSSARIRLP